MPVLVEVMVEREANAAMGKAIDSIVEFEPVPDAAEVAPEAMIPSHGTARDQPVRQGGDPPGARLPRR